MDTNTANTLMAWYDANRRHLDWRIHDQQVAKGSTRNPYHTWLSEIMLQQTTVEAGKPYFLHFINTWPTVQELAKAHDDNVMKAWAGLGYYARARNLLKAARAIVEHHNGIFPADEKTLLTLPGVGPYTAAAIVSIGHNLPAKPVDGNIERIGARVLGSGLPVPSKRKHLHTLCESLYDNDVAKKMPSDFPQALMDLGAQICRPQNPKCLICPIHNICESANSDKAQKRPRRDPKKAKSQQQATILLIKCPEKGWLLEKRADTGLLGGSLGWPMTTTENTEPTPPEGLSINWQNLGMYVHIFTHIHMTATVWVGTISPSQQNEAFWNTMSKWATQDTPKWEWHKQIIASNLPGLMKKAWQQNERDEKLSNTLSTRTQVTKPRPV